MPHVQSIVAVSAICGVAFLALGVYRFWSAWAASKQSRIQRGRLRLPIAGRRDRAWQIAFAAVYLLIGAFLLVGAQPRVVRVPHDVPSATDGPDEEWMQVLAARRWHSGLVVGIARGGKRNILCLGTLGLASRQPPRADAVFPIGSITKTFTGILLADMVGRGEVAMSDPVSRYLPPGVTTPEWPGQEMTLLDLATHTSGLPRMPPHMGPSARKLLNWQLLRDRYRGHSLDELFERLSEITLSAEPGPSFVYSNLGMGLLGHALERAAGVGYENLIRRRIAAPLGMPSTRIELTPSLSSRLAPGFFDAWRLGRVGVEFPAPRWKYSVLQGAGALVSSGEDLLRFLEANLRVPATRLGDAIRQSHFRRHERDGQGGGIGLGWHLTPLPDEQGELIWHSGATSGYTSFLGFVPRHEVGVFILNNTAEPIDGLARQVLDKLIENSEVDDIELATSVARGVPDTCFDMSLCFHTCLTSFQERIRRLQEGTPTYADRRWGTRPGCACQLGSPSRDTSEKS